LLVSRLNWPKLQAIAMPHPEQLPAPETLADRRSRIAWEAERIAEVRASAAAGDIVSFEAIEAWVPTTSGRNRCLKPNAERRPVKSRGMIVCRESALR
jgi:hypothetical protein